MLSGSSWMLFLRCCRQLATLRVIPLHSRAQFMCLLKYIKNGRSQEAPESLASSSRTRRVGGSSGTERGLLSTGGELVGCPARKPPC
jgi:hypothetical protein